jgi:transcriptional regulator with XRE-family HTH domain
MVAPNGYDERFAALLKERKLTAAEMAARLRISYQAVKKIVDGKSKMMAADNNAKAAAILGVDSDWLATGEGSKARSTPQFSQAALRVAAIYDSVTPKDRRHIDAAADAASSPDDPPEEVTDSDDQPLPGPTPAPVRRS